MGAALAAVLLSTAACKSIDDPVDAVGESAKLVGRTLDEAGTLKETKRHPMPCGWCQNPIEVYTYEILTPISLGGESKYTAKRIDPDGSTHTIYAGDPGSETEAESAVTADTRTLSPKRGYHVGGVLFCKEKCAEGYCKTNGIDELTILPIHSG